MVSPDGSIHTTHTPPPLSFYNTFKQELSIMVTFNPVSSIPPKVIYDPDESFKAVITGL